MYVSAAVLALLEFQKTLYPFQNRLKGDLGQQYLASLTPSTNMEQLKKRHELLRAWRDCTDKYGELPWNSSAVCVSGLFPAAKKSGILLGDELLKVRQLLQLAMQIRKSLSELKSEYAPFEALERRIRDFSPELDKLAVVEDTGRLADRASPKLQEIRSELETLKRGARKTAMRLMDDNSILNMLQERSLSFRDGRFLLLVRQEYVNRFPGLLVDRSASGNSVYMEPRILSSINNGLVLKTRDERDEETRILMELTHEVLNRAGAITEAESTLGAADLLSSAREVMKQGRWVMPELSAKTAFSLIGARHPLLKDAAVPIDVSCGGSFTALVVTGPNTGGKTLVLKTSAVCVILAWMGLPIPARDGSFVGNIDALYADIGDEQSIEQNLSTFSAHLKNITAILKAATRNSLVLLDELGAGTDPQEGAALGIAILETLKKNRVLTLATTHHNPIKQYALTTPSVETASMEFDIDRLAPTYHLLMGVPGKSNALLIAKRHGMPAEVLQLAYDTLKSHELSAEEVMGQLQERRAALDQLERRVDQEHAEAERLKQAYLERVAEIDYQKDKIIEAADKRASELLTRAESTSREMIKGLEEAAKSMAHKELQSKKHDLHKIRKGLEEREAKRLAREIEKQPDAFAPKEGMTVQIAGSEVVGVIETLKNGKASIIAGPMHLEVPVEQLLPTKKTAKVAVPPVDTTMMMKKETVPSSIMVRGMNVDEAMPLTASYLDRAYRAGHSSVLVIHGRGEGILRREVHALCARLKYVENYRLGDVGEGGYGVTVVTFKK